MTRRLVLSIIGLILCAGSGSALAANDPDPAVQPQGVATEFSGVVLLATHKMKIKTNANVASGDAIVNDVGDKLEIGEDVFVAGNLKSDEIKIGKRTTIAGSASYNSLDSKGTIQGGEITPLALPVFAVLPPFQSAPAGSQDLELDENETLTLAPGDYGKIKLRKNATLIFTGGEYNLREIDSGEITQLLFQDPARVRIEGRLKLEKNSVIGPQAGSGADASDIIFFVGGNEAVIKEFSSVKANIYTPNGPIKLEKSTVAVGAFIAYEIVVNEDVQVNLDSFFEDDAPRARDDGPFVVAEGGSVSGNVLTNDVEPDGQPFAITFNSPASFGAVSLAASGDFTYVHDGSETSGDSFTYEICDNEAPPQCDTADVTFVVTPVNDAPEADPQAVLTTGMQALNLTLTGTDVEGGPLTFTIDSGPGAGTLSALTQFPPFAATVTYTPNTANDVEDSFTFKVTDPGGAFDTAVVSINPIEDPPVPTGTLTATDDSVEVLEDTPLDIVLAAFLDVANPDSFGDLSFAIVSGPDHGTLDPLMPLGTPVRSAATTYTPDAAFVGEDSFDFEVCGDLGSGVVCDTATVSIVVAAFAPPPPPVPPVAENKTVAAVVDKPTVVDLSPGSVDDGTEPPGPRDKTVAEEVNNGSAATKAGGHEKATALTVDGGWTSFNNCAIDVPCPAGPFTFTIASGGACVSVTDAFVKSDQFTLTEGGVVLGVTSAPSPDDGQNQSDPDLAYADPLFSSGTFVVGAGSRSVDVTRTASDLGGLAAAFIRVDSPGTTYCASFTNLTATAFSAPAQAGLGEVIGDQIQVTVTNTGTVDIAAGTSAAIGFYVSTDNMITTDDTLLTGGRENLSVKAPNGLAVGESISDFLFTGASVNTASPTGNVFIGVLVDEFDEVAESDENDNVASQAIVIDAVDLVVSSLTHDPASPTTEDQIEFTATVQNVGTATAGASELCFQIGGEGCTPETLFDVPSLQAGATHVVTRFAGLPQGNYQNTAIADFNDAVEEANEDNNTTIDTYTVTLASEPRVVATILTLPTNGTLLDINGLPISAGQTLTGTQLTFVPSSTGTAFFEYTLTDQSTGLTSVVAAVDVSIGSLVDLCAVVGRPPGCAPGG